MMKKVAAVLIALVALTGCSSTDSTEKSSWEQTPLAVETSEWSMQDPVNACISYEFVVPERVVMDAYGNYIDTSSDNELFATNWREEGAGDIKHAIAVYLDENPDVTFSMRETCPSQERLDELHAKQKAKIESLKGEIAVLEECMLTDTTKEIEVECMEFYFQ